MDDEIGGIHHESEYFWDYMRDILTQNLYWEEHYNGEKVPLNRRGYVFFESKLLTPPRLLQQRVVYDYMFYIHTLHIKQFFGFYGDRRKKYFL